MEKSLIETNPYLRDPDEVRRMILRGAWDSSVFEGANLAPLEHYLAELERDIRSNASEKKVVCSDWKWRELQNGGCKQAREACGDVDDEVYAEYTIHRVRDRLGQWVEAGGSPSWLSRSDPFRSY